MSYSKGPVETEKAYRAILSAISRIEQFISGYNQKSFEADAKTISAVCYEFVVIGERVYDLNKENYFNNSPFNDQIDWNKVGNQRHFLSHEYWEDIDAEIIWNTIKKHIPVLKEALNWHLKKESEN